MKVCFHSAMTYNQVIKYFGGKQETADHFEIDVKAVHQWQKWVPEARQREIALLSGGKLKVTKKQSKDKAA